VGAVRLFVAGVRGERCRGRPVVDSIGVVGVGTITGVNKLGQAVLECFAVAVVVVVVGVARERPDDLAE